MRYVVSKVDVAMVALTFHQCGPGSIPELNAICGLSLMLLYSAPRGFLRVLWFSSLIKTLTSDLIRFREGRHLENL